MWTLLTSSPSPQIRKARCKVADAHGAGDVFMYRCSSIALLLDLRRRLKAVMDVLDSMIRSGVSLARSVELSVEWDRILLAGPVYPVALDDFHAGGGAGIGDFIVLRVIFTTGLVILSQGCGASWGPFGCGGIGNGRTPSSTLTSGFDLTWFTLAPFFQCKLHLTSGGSGVLADPARIDEEFRKAWLLHFCRSGQLEGSLEEFDREVDGWLPLLQEFIR